MKENNENDLISRQALYDKCVELEQEALKIVQTVDDKIEKLIWNAVLTERSAFKFSVMDAPASLSNPSAETEWKNGRWKPDESGNAYWICSACGFASEAFGADILYHFCPHCGARMEDE